VPAVRDIAPENWELSGVTVGKTLGSDADLQIQLSQEVTFDDCAEQPQFNAAPAADNNSSGQFKTSSILTAVVADLSLRREDAHVADKGASLDGIWWSVAEWSAA
jgi:hypothetical protein